MDELLDRMTSHELTEWRAYERYAGPLDGSWDAETRASIHELLQDVRHLYGEVNFADRRKGKKNPVPDPKRWPRPRELYDKQDDDDDDEEE